VATTRIEDVIVAVGRLPANHAPASPMPEGLANAPSLEDLVARVEFLAARK
jgi:hypothetical protein